MVLGQCSKNKTCICVLLSNELKCLLCSCTAFCIHLARSGNKCYNPLQLLWISRHTLCDHPSKTPCQSVMGWVVMAPLAPQKWERGQTLKHSKSPHLLLRQTKKIAPLRCSLRYCIQVWSSATTYGKCWTHKVPGIQACNSSARTTIPYFVYVSRFGWFSSIPSVQGLNWIYSCIMPL